MVEQDAVAQAFGKGYRQLFVSIFQVKGLAFVDWYTTGIHE